MVSNQCAQSELRILWILATFNTRQFICDFRSTLKCQTIVLDITEMHIHENI